MLGKLLSSRVRCSAMAAVLLAAAVWMQSRHWPGVAFAQEAGKTSDRKPLVLDRAPARNISDPNPVFRAVVLDAEHGEIFVANDKESAGTSILVYPTQFTPTDKIIEPRRRIAGPKTDLGMVCGLALSIEHGELFSVSGETGTLNVFPMDAKGNIGPERRLRGVMPRASAGVYLDVKNDELFITTEHVNRISVYPRTFEEKQDPVRFIQGPSTGIGDPHGIYVDSEANEVFVSNHGNWRRTETGEGELRGPDSLTRTSLGYTVPGKMLELVPSTGKFMGPSITVHSRTASGDAAPLRTIHGPHTQLNLPDGISKDPVTGELIVGNTGGDSILFFAKDASGDATPTRVLKGPATRIKGPVGATVDGKRNELWVASWDNHIAGVFPRTANGNMKPLRVIRTAPDNAPLASMGRIGAVAYDPKRKEILAPN
jgi:DNA-binding beta-propeller fold protein YncE